MYTCYQGTMKIKKKKTVMATKQELPKNKCYKLH